jgi:hypothetical protein
MKVRKSSIIGIGLCVILCSSFIASAESISDGTGDVWHWSQTGTAWSWTGNVAGKPNIDITQVSAIVNGNKLTLSLSVAGAIQYSPKIWYWAFFNTTDSSYSMYWYNGTGFGIASNHSFGYDYVQNLTISGSTLRAVFNVLGDTSRVELWGWAAEYTTVGTSQTTNEWWGDWAPNSKLPFTPGTGGYTGNNTGENQTGGNNTGKKTPGFEVIPVIAAVAVAAILLRRRR